MTDANNADEEDGRLCDGADPWELSKLLRSFVEENGEQRLAAMDKPALLLTTGSMSPIHQGHIAMMFTARERIEQEGFQVVHGWISPSHDLYTEPKAM